MLLELTADQQSLRDTTARFLAQTVPVDRLRQLHKQPAGYDGDYWRQGAALGWTSLLVSAEAGGGNVSGQPAVDATLLAYEFGRHSAPGPFLSSNLVAAALDGERPRRHHDVLQGLLDGSVVASWCFVEPHQHDLGPAGISFDITVDGGEVVLNGIKSPVEAGVRPCYLLVTGRSPDGPTQVLVPPGVAGLTLTPMESVDLTRRFSSARFDQVRLPFDAVVGGPGDAGDQLERQLRHALVLQSAESVGAMQRAFDMTVQWAFDRYSFGRPLASYQELKHRFADMKTCLE
ncbi:MAG: acyl-CoA dehydrogenase family protein, partial [Acidimicrobiales bacterium]